MKWILLILIFIMFVFDTTLSVLNYRNRKAKMPDSVKDIYDPEKYESWLKYNMANFKMGMIGSVLSTALMILLLSINAFGWLEQVIDPLSTSVGVETLLFMLFYYLFTWVISLPLEYYQIFEIEASFGFNKMTKKLFWIDQLKGILLTVIFGGGIIGLLHLVYRQFESNVLGFAILSYLILTIIMILVMLLSKYFMR
ncbi:hypothetical protein N7603_07475 [Acholeplasma vituli]|uniref:CAAX prenyl protease 1 N-terminal domain-containing protein n=1 Tax=Paracholeplasma vituli TaxID=69473 RepID=A0ABT2PYD7_9MOLU|nr:hypothetical protein [Paracholeplasma vituli]MCU0105496.1 hypothetical protein [Paracholeplasma vituli]